MRRRQGQARPSLLTLTLAALTALLLVQILRERSPVPPASGPAQSAGPPPGSAANPAGTNTFANAEAARIRIFEAWSPSVVSVANRALVRAGWFGLQVVEIPNGAGSGFVWDRQGHIISNYHVVHGASALTVTFSDGASFEARVTGIDPDRDLAVLRIEAGPERLNPIPLGASKHLRVGQNVLAIGNPFGLDTTLTTGIVSALGRTITAMTERRIYDVIQTDAAINPGNSGGPLLDGAGRLIGINTAILSPSGAYAGIGFAVPVDTIGRIVPQLIEQGRVSRAGLGVRLLPDHMLRRTGIEGAAVQSVMPGSPAAAADMRGLSRTPRGDLVLGDVVTALDGHPVRTVEDMLAVLDRRTPGDAVDVEILRNRQTQTLHVRLADVGP